MQYVAFIAFAALVIGGPVAGWHASEVRERGEEPQTIVDAMVDARRDSVKAMERNRERREKARKRLRVRRASGAPAAVFDFRHLGSQQRNGVSDEHRDILMTVANAKQVPAGPLYGIWTNESSRLAGGWSDRWHRPRDLLAPGSKCRRYRANDPWKCDQWYESLRRICAQERPDGSEVCDIDNMRVSFTFDLGPYQQNASRIVSRRNGTYQWNLDIADYDGDGVYDPHDLQESMTATAVILRREHDECEASGRRPAIGCWGWAVNAYAGNQSRRYYERRIWGLWQRWCSTPGYCG
ncbi:MAG: hypothetical protein U9Q03_06380 [Patescibacteria group bacterium]|nr:hypothetical protein [Patescibacteria group bacterium]